jgi:AcrR family transcriptional regulator
LRDPGVIQNDRSYRILAGVPRRSAADVADSRASAVETAVDLASVEGLEGITIGRLANELGMSKSGLIGRFGDKQALQRAVLAAAVERFTAAVWRPARRFEPGLPRLEAIVDGWIGHLREGVFPGGCFVTTASVEYDSRPGALHDDVAQAVRGWLDLLETEAHRAQEVGDIPADRDPADVALELHSLASGGSVAGRLTGDAAALGRTHAAMRRAIGLPATNSPRSAGQSTARSRGPGDRR